MGNKGKNINRFHKHQRASRKSWRDDKRTAHERGYTARWQRVTKVWLKENPLCCICASRGRTSAAEVVDHIKPHQGDMDLFWCVDNWQPLCKHCHDSEKKIIEHQGYSNAVGNDGWPVDLQHPVNTFIYQRHGGVVEKSKDHPPKDRPPSHKKHQTQKNEEDSNDQEK